MNIYTIGFARKTAEQFFETLRRSGARHLLDIRLNNRSQLAGFTKKTDVKYFLKNLINMEYHEVALLAPDKALLEAYRKNHDWAAYEKQYTELISRRQAQNQVDMNLLKEGAVLLCSEPDPTKCHRRLAAEYLVRTLMPDASIAHL